MNTFLSTRMIFLASFIISVMFSAAMLYLITENNNQGEIYDTVTGAIDWWYFTKISAVFFLVAYAFTATVMLLVRSAFGIFRR
jgi:hypothetical protein